MSNKISIWKIIKKLVLVKNLIQANIELIKYAITITTDLKLKGILERIRINIESIFGKYIDDI